VDETTNSLIPIRSAHITGNGLAGSGFGWLVVWGCMVACIVVFLPDSF
jgi:hypothetical protein